MRKLIIACSLLLMGTTANAQKGFYTDINFGYGVCIPNSVIAVDLYKNLDNPDLSYQRNVYGTLGRGFNVSVNPGYMITKHIGVELGINYFIGAESMLDTNKTTSDPNLYDVTKAKSNQLRIIPAVVVNTGGEKLYGYAKAGLVLPIAGSTEAVRSASFSVLVDPINHVKQVYSNEFKATVNGSFSLGFKGSLGIGYNFTPNIGLNLEVFCTALQVKAKTRKVVETAKVDGVVVENDPAPTYYTETNYVDNLSAYSNNDKYNPNFDVTKPKDELARKTSFNQFGFNFGITFKVGSKSTKE